MIPMPYILVNIVMSALSLIFFCTTTAALLTRWRFANLWLPAALRTPRCALIGQGLVLSILSIVAVRVIAGFFQVPRWVISDVLVYIGVVNSVVLIHQFMDKRYLLNMPRLPRRLVIAAVAVVVPCVLVIAVAIAVVGLFVIR